MAARRRASATWDGTLTEGQGEATLASGVTGALPMSWRARTAEGEANTSPEELIAAAHASCFSMALSDELGKAGVTSPHVETKAAATFDQVGDGWRITTVALTVRVAAEGLDEETLTRAADDAKVGCPVSQALQGNVEITLDAALA
jgi:osmotically inducible protein OsmC